jgi:hypothetical protein
MKPGDKVFIKSYTDRDATPYLRPAEVSFVIEGSDCVQIRFLDERFCKGGRAKHTVTCLMSNIVKEETR